MAYISLSEEEVGTVRAVLQTILNEKRREEQGTIQPHQLARLAEEITKLKGALTVLGL